MEIVVIIVEGFRKVRTKAHVQLVLYWDCLSRVDSVDTVYCLCDVFNVRLTDVKKTIKFSNDFVAANSNQNAYFRQDIPKQLHRCRCLLKAYLYEPINQLPVCVKYLGKRERKVHHELQDHQDDCVVKEYSPKFACWPSLLEQSVSKYCYWVHYRQ